LIKKQRITSIIIAIILLFLILIIGIAGFMIIEGFPFIDAFFMTIITMSTVGFSEVRDLTDAGMVFTSFLIIFSFGIFAYVVTTFTRYIVDGIFRNYFKDNKVKKRIKKLSGHVIVCGYGRNGKQAIKGLVDHNQQTIIIENDEALIEKIREETDLLYIHGDSTQEEILVSAQVSNAKALITTLPNDADNLFVVLTAREMNPEMIIISRAYDEHSDIKLKRAGATNVIMPDKMGGQHMAKLVAQPDIVEFLDYIMLQKSSDVKLEEVSCENLAECYVNKSIRELDIRNASGANIVGLRREDGTYIINPEPDVLLTCTDKLFVLGIPGEIERLHNVMCETR